MLARKSDTETVETRAGRTPKKRFFPDGSVCDYSAAFSSAQKAKWEANEIGRMKKARIEPISPEDIPSPAAVAAPPAVAATLAEQARRRSRTGRFEKNIESSACSGWPSAVSADIASAAEEAVASAGEKKPKKYIKKADRIAAAAQEEAAAAATAAAEEAVSVEPKKPKGPKKYIKKADRIAAAEKEAAATAAAEEATLNEPAKKPKKYIKIADRIAAAEREAAAAALSASSTSATAAHMELSGDSGDMPPARLASTGRPKKYIKKADRIVAAEREAAAAVSPAATSNWSAGWASVDPFVEVATAAAEEAISAQPKKPKGPKKYIKKADRIAAAEREAAAAALSASSSNSAIATHFDLRESGEEVFLPASAYDRNPGGVQTPVVSAVAETKKPRKYIKKADRIAAEEREAAAIGAGVVESIAASSSSMEKSNDADLGPPMPPLLTIETNFKRKKGYYYDPITNIATPSREDEKSKFKSCLLEFDERSSPLLDSASKMSRTFVLQRALSIEELNDSSWLSSSLIDLVFARLARNYDTVDFLPADFAVMLTLPSSNHSELLQATDILGRRLAYDSNRPMLLLYNSKNIHWILIKVQFLPEPELQLFEPMGQPINKKRGMSYRIVPRDVVRWLDTCCPLPDKTSWLSRAVSAITSQQQFTSFDCGVACLLYAEKCGQGQSYTQIDNSTSQQDITGFRKHLQNFVSQLQFGGAPRSF